MKMKLSDKDIDVSILDKIIANCEREMVSPFKKKKEMDVVIEGSPEEEDGESADEENAEGDDKLSDDDMQQLMEYLEKMKGK